MDKSLLDLYADYLIALFGPTTATGLSRLLQAHFSHDFSHDKITRFLSGRPYTSANLWQIVKPLVRQMRHHLAQGKPIRVRPAIRHRRVRHIRQQPR